MFVFFYLQATRGASALSGVLFYGSLHSLHQFFTFDFILVTLARDRIAAAVSNRITDCLKKNLKASRPSEHPSIKGQNVKTFR